MYYQGLGRDLGILFPLPPSRFFQRGVLKLETIYKHLVPERTFYKLFLKKKKILPDINFISKASKNINEIAASKSLLIPSVEVDRTLVFCQ